MIERTCRGAFRKAGIYPFNPKAVLDEIPLKEIEKERLTEPSDGDSANLLATPAADTSFTPKQKQNTAAVQSHVVAVTPLVNGYHRGGEQATARALPCVSPHNGAREELPQAYVVSDLSASHSALPWF